MDTTINGMVSFIMPVYNSRDFISEAIESVISQGYQNWELLILDDYSTDDSLAIAKSYDDKRIKIFTNDYNIGIVKSRNKLIDFAVGEYLAILDSDDIADASRANVQVNFLLQNPDYAFCATGVNYFGLVNEFYSQELDHEALKIEMFFHNIIAHSSLMFNRRVIDKSDLYYFECEGLAEDYRLITKILFKYKGYLLPNILLQYRIHKNNSSKNKAAIYTGQNIAFFNLLNQFEFLSYSNLYEHLFHGIFNYPFNIKKLDDFIYAMKLIEEKNETFKVYQPDLFSQKLQTKTMQVIKRELFIHNEFYPSLIFIFYKIPIFFRSQIDNLTVFKFIVKSLIYYKRVSFIKK